jgi:N-acetylglutamate synthase-like GNAT family acetyltransferase
MTRSADPAVSVRPFRLRAAKMSDIEAIMRICRQDARGDLCATKPRQLTEAIAEAETFGGDSARQLLVALLEPRCVDLIGFLNLHHLPDGRTRLLGLGVCQTMRGQGVGRRLLHRSFCEAVLRDSVLIEAPAGAATGYLQRFGFARTTPGGAVARRLTSG